MTELSESAWGHPSRHYAASTPEVFRGTSPSDEQASSRWANALEQASPGIRDSVERTYKQWNTILRDYLRSETALRLSGEGYAQSVPVRVVDGMPWPVAEVMDQFDGLEWLLLNRPLVAAAALGTSFMERNVDSVRAAWGDAAGPSDKNEIGRVRATAEAWLRKLDETQVVEQIVGIEEDVMCSARTSFKSLRSVCIGW